MSERSPSVVGIGWMLRDSFALLSQYPAEDTKAETLGEFDQVGGPVPRALSVLANLGVSVSLATTVGDDEAGTACVDTLASRGVATNGVQVVPNERTRHAQVWLSSSSGSRTIAYSRGTLPDLQPTDDFLDHLETASLLHSDGRELGFALRAAGRMREHGGMVVVDAGGWKPNLEQMLDLTDVLIVSAGTLRGLDSGDPLETAKRLRDAHEVLTAVVVTAGDAGSWILEGGAPVHVPAFPIRPVDTNGAGDAFSGGLLYGLVRKWSLRQSVEFAAGVAAITCSHFGDYFATVAEVDELVGLQPRDAGE